MKIKYMEFILEHHL